PRHTLGHFRVSVTSAERPPGADPTRALPGEVRAALAAAEPDDAQRETVARYFRSIAPQLAEARGRLDELTNRREAVVKENTRTSLITVSVEPRPIRVLPRGDWMDDS